jgi:nucleoside-diphosphate-sugar epimerase
MAFHKFIRAGIAGNPIQVYGAGTQTRDFTYVSDVVSVTHAAATLGQDGQAYNIGGGNRWPLKDILKAIELTINRSLRVLRLPMQPGDVRDTFADTSRARGDLLFKPSVVVTEGLINEAAWIAEALRTGLLSA